jgi:ribonuclease D
MSEPILVANESTLALLRDRLRNEPLACFDAEGPGQGAFPDRLCLLVVAAAGHVHVVDPFEVDVRALGDEFAREDRPFIVHDVAYDARLFAIAGLRLGLVHDTGVAATMLGKPKTGLASLALELLGVHVDKSLQASAWARRPLDARAMRYLSADAELPRELYRTIWPSLEAADLVDETLTETRYRVERAAEAIEELRTPGWWKLPFARGLRTSERRWLRSAWIARDRVAKHRDRAPAMLFTDDELEKLTRSVPESVEAIRARIGRRANDASLLAALVDAFAARDAAVPEEELARLDAPIPSSAERERQKRVRKRLTGWRAEEAKARGVSETAIVPGHLADRLSVDPASLRARGETLSGMGRRRFERYGDTLLRLLEEP